MHLSLLFIQWNPDANALTFGNFSIKWYGVLWGISLMSCFFLGNYVFRQSNKSNEKVTVAIQYIFIFGLIGARLVHVLFYGLSFYVSNPWDEIDILNFKIPIPTVLAVWQGGLASHGGVIGGLIGLYIFCRRNPEFDFFWTLDHGIICVVLLAALIRFGNLMNSEECGTVTHVPWAFVFVRYDDLPRHPVVLYECMIYLCIQIFMLFLFNKYHESRPGIYLVVFLVLVFAVRFALEFMKVPDGPLYFGILSMSQLLTLPFIFAGLVLWYFVSKGKLHYRNILHG